MPGAILTKKSSLERHNEAQIESKVSRITSDVENNGTSVSKEFVLSKGSSWFAFITFLMIGATALIGWNSLLNMLTALLTVVYKGQNTFTDTMTATYFTVVCIVTLTSARIDVARPSVLITGLISMGLLCITLALICSFVRAVFASLVLHVFGGVMGFVVGITVSSAFGIASFLPKLYVGAVAAGMGFAGLITFSLWMLGSHAVFEYDAIGVRSSIWMLLGCSAGISFLALVLFFIFMRSGWVLDFFEEQRLLSEAKAFTQQTYNGKMVEDESDPKSYERLGFWGIAWEVSGNVTCRFLIFFETLVVFPSIGPVGWTDTAVVKDIATGAFQLLDFLGRYLPNVVPFLLIPESYLKWAIILRLPLVLTFILSMTYPGVAVLGDAWFHIIQMALLAFTNGWLSTVATVHLPSHVNGAEAKSRASSFGICFGFIGICAGQWASKLLKVILRH